MFNWQDDPWREFEMDPPAQQPSGAPQPLIQRPRSAPMPTPMLPLQEENLRSTIADREADNALRREQIENSRADREERARARREALELRTTRRPLTDRAVQPLTEGVTGLVDYERLRGRFQDTFSGPGSGWENTFQGMLGTGTEGQRQWWADMAAMDNQLRNALFGASLTEGEKAAWEATTVSPNMTPEEVRRNLEERQNIARGALGRLARTRRSQGYDPDQIRSVLEQYGDLLDETQTPEFVDPATQAGRAMGAALPGAVRDQLPSLTEPTVNARTGVGLNNQGELGVMDLAINAPDQLREGLRLNPQQYNELIAFAQTRPTAQQLDQWFRDNGFGGLGNAEAVARAIQNGQIPSGINYDRVDQAVQPDISDVRGGDAAGAADQATSNVLRGTMASAPYELARLIGGGEGAQAFQRGAADMGTFGFYDEISGATNALATGGNVSDSIARERAIDAHDSENNFGMRLAGQFVGGAGLPFPAVRAGQVGMFGRYVPQMRAGAAYGAGYGFGSGDGNLGERAANAGAMAGVGAVAPPVIDGLFRAPGALVRGVRSMRTPPPTPAIDMGASTPLEVADAMVMEGIRGPRAIADPTQRGRLAVAETTPGGHPIVNFGLSDTQAQIANRAGRFADGGVPQSRGVMGEAIQSAGERRLSALKDRARSNYTAADRQARADFTAAETRRSGSRGTALATVNEGYILPSNLAAALDERIASLARNEAINRPTINLLNSYRRNLVGQDGNLRRVTIQDLREMRTGLAGEINRRQLSMTNAERLVNESLDAASDDVVRAVGTVSPRALDRYQRGDAIWRQMHTDKTEVVERLVGPANNRLSGEATVNRLVGMMRPNGDFQRYRRVLDMMTPEERSNFRATIFENVGRKAPGEPFSPALLVSHLRGFSDESLGRLLGKEGVQSVRNLRVIARAFNDMDSARNRSRSGFVMNMRDLVGQLMNWRSAAGATAGTMIAGPAGGIAGMAIGQGLRYGGEALSARAIMNPDVSRWMAQMVKARDPGAVRRLIREAGPIMRRNPAIAAELEPVVNALTASNDNLLTYTGQAAASGDERRRQ